MDLRVLSYNCRGLRLGQSAADQVRRVVVDKLLEQCEVLCLQETFLTKQDLDGLNSLHIDFHGAGESTVDIEDGIIRGRIPGGVAILWDKRLDSYVNVIRLEVDWCIAIHLKLNGKECVIFNVYTPWECHHNETEFLNRLAFINCFIRDHNFLNVFIIGDLNSDISDCASTFGNHLKQFWEDNGLTLSTGILLPEDSFTHISEAWHTTSWLDHCVTSADAHASLTNMKIFYELALADHIPFGMQINFLAFPIRESYANKGALYLDWNALSQDEVSLYSRDTDRLLSDIYLPREAISCGDVNCKSSTHVLALWSMYENIIYALLNPSKSLYKPKSRKRGSPGWNAHVKELFLEAKEATKEWIVAGKPRQGPIFEHKRATNARYKYAIRFISRNNQAMRSDSMARNLSCHKTRDSWKEVKHINSGKQSIPCVIDGVSGPENILEHWRQHYSTTFNCGQTDEVYKINDVGACDAITVHEVLQASAKLSDNKATGLDDVSTEHTKFASPKAFPLLSMCFTSFLTHGFLPDSMLDVLTVPVLKNKAGKISCSDNYRPIALASVMSKLFEFILLDKITKRIESTDNQFGFKEKLGADMCVYVLKEMISKCRNQNSSVFLCFLDGSKAFDRVNHWKLFRKMEKRGVPKCFVRILSYWYAQQSMQVKWGNLVSEPFKISNGVRQGSILSPLLFNLYVDELSLKLNACHTGCVAGDLIINHLMYADDIVLLSPSTAGLQQLLKICSDYGVDHDIVFNAGKSMVMISKTKEDKNVKFPDFHLRNVVLACSDRIKYLGHIITEDMTDDADIYRQCRVLYGQANTLSRKFGFCTDRVKLTLFKAFCSPLYTAHLWVNYKTARMRKLQVAYNDALRVVLRKPRWTSASELFVFNRINTLHALLRNLIFKFICRLDSTKNTLIMSIHNIRFSAIRFSSSIWKHWRSCLFIFPF
ncbi:uncharacterized protein LOC112138347 [Oryzias melastigma]|uniref:uncharacterized protein LOC112138347 n=1 Tax=Oryzias melastigma TaxID=30732 RepID=UPI00168CE5B8|nr:uncharacterized protein LOC112138347 [Oryzias melastigma]